MFNDFHIKNLIQNNNNKLIICIQANMFYTKNKQCRNKGNNKNMSKSTFVLKYYNCSKSEHFSHNCQKLLTQLTLNVWVKKSNSLTNTVKVTNTKSVLVVTTKHISMYIKQVLNVEMTEILAS